ncbi:MAG: hypothetical protein EP349_03845 [Alphaproteobacteria bacterium]|nr:MAG: hypothetical protein EP349_03845 [Alphaproteobacteria bacterium]
MKRNLLIILCLAVVAAAVWDIQRSIRNSGTAAVFPAAQFTQLDSKYLEDRANLLGGFSNILDEVARRWDETLGIELKIITFRGGATPIEKAAVKLFKQYKVGENAKTGGLLILIDAENRQARIEPSLTLEGLYTDAILGLLAHDQLAPYASYRAVGMAIMDVVRYLENRAIEQAFYGNFEIHGSYKDTEYYKMIAGMYSGGAGAQADITQADFDRDYKKALSDAELKRYAPAAKPEETIAAYKRSFRDYIGYPELPLFTKGSQEMRKRYPYAVYEERDRLRNIERSEPLYIEIDGDYAVAYSKTPAPRFMPILMKKLDGLWRIDMSEALKNLFFLNDGGFSLMNANTPYYKSLEEIYGTAKHYDDMRAFPLQEELSAVVKKLEERTDPLAKFMLAELLFRNAFAFVDALKYYEEAARMAPTDPRFIDIFAQRGLYAFLPDLVLPYMKRFDHETALKILRLYSQKKNYTEAEKFASQELEKNPFDLGMLGWLEWAYKKQDKNISAASIRKKIEKIKADPKAPGKKVVLSFKPDRAVYHSLSTNNVDGQVIYGHSEFSVTMTNTSKAPVEILSVNLISAGTGATSGLGDIKDYWEYPSSDRVLEPDQSLSFKKLWGFTSEPGHQRVSYIFDVCWKQDGRLTKQCNAQRVDLISDQNFLEAGKK